MTDEPFGMRYEINTLAPEDAYFVTFYLGFRIEPRINLLFRNDLVASKEITIVKRYRSMTVHRIAGDFCFVLFKRFLSNDNEITTYRQLVLYSYFLLKRISLYTKEAYGLDTKNVLTEAVPLVLPSSGRLPLE